MTDTALTALAICFKFLFYLSSFQACGTALLLIVFNVELKPEAQTCTRHIRRWAALCAISAIGIVATTSFPLFAVGGTALLMDYLLSTGYATALAVQLCACAAILCRGIIAAVAAISLLASYTLVGHIGPSIFAGILILHLIVGSMWFAILAPLKRLSLGSNSHQAASLGGSFGRLAQGFVPLSLMLGAVLAWSVSSNLFDLITSPYGWALCGKIICSTALLWAGAQNKLRLVPALKTADPSAAPRLARMVHIEWWLFILILGITAVLTTIMTPP